MLDNRDSVQMEFDFCNFMQYPRNACDRLIMIAGQTVANFRELISEKLWNGLSQMI